MERYPLVSPKNLPAYAAVMGTWLVITAALAAGLRWLTNASLPWASAVGFAAVAVMLGMSIMFVASVVNLRKLRPGFERLADGAADPEIPPVWCPVLTMATRSALDLRARVAPDQMSEQELT